MKLDIGSKIHKLRIGKKLSMRELGEKIGVSHAHISKLESGINSPSVELLEKLAEYFDIDVTYFFISEEDEKIFSDNEKSLLYERDLSLESIKRKYDLIDEIEPSDEEVQKMVEYIKAIRIMTRNESS
jgi:transcriptional regulator with XRE-family HTH domain